MRSNSPMACNIAAWEIWQAAAAPESDPLSATATTHCNGR